MPIEEIQINEEDLDIDYDSDDVSEICESDFPKAKPTLNDSLENCIVCTGIPITKKVAKLTTKMNDLFGDVGTVVSSHIPEKNGESTGVMFLAMKNPDHANNAIEKLNGYDFDTAHKLSVFNVAQIDEILGVPEKFVEPKPPVIEDSDNLRHWLLDEKARGMYATRFQNETAIFWNDHTLPNPLEHKAETNWAGSFVQWSSHGTYFATAHDNGIRLWGGPNWKEIHRFPHHRVELIQFSPCDQFLVTFSPQNTAQQVIVWDLKSGKEMRSFGDIPLAEITWPYFQWSHDDTYLSHVSPQGLRVLESATFKMIKNRDGKRQPIDIPSIRDAEWSPGANILAYWQPELGERPARVTLLNVKGLKEVRQKNIFNVDKCVLSWQSEGKFLAVKIDRVTKAKKPSHTDFELFCCHAKGVPVELCEIKDPITAFAFEPKGDRFTIIHGSSSSSQSVSFYQLNQDSAANRLEKLHTVKDKTVNRIYWSPQGSVCLLAGVGRGMENGCLEFWDVNDLLQLGSAEHYLATDIAWEPSGRFVSTTVTHFNQTFENGFNIWNFHGKLIHTVKKDKFFQLSWRPLPPTLLTDEDMAHVKKSLKKWAAVFDDEDRKVRDTQSQLLDSSRAEALKVFNLLMQKRQEQWADEQDDRQALRGGAASDDEDDWEEKEVVKRTIISEKEVVVE